tara:strand:- start:155 stop:310 length:156 start_codon:yes stop_codon:yes gene_type:complete
MGFKNIKFLDSSSKNNWEINNDEVRHGNKCKKLKLKELGYSCKEIESQIFK